MKIALVGFILILFVSCQLNSKQKKEIAIKKSNVFYVGTYTKGVSKGIYKYILNTDGTMDSIGLAAKSKNPSFITFSTDKKYLIAANEISDSTGQGTVESYAVTEDSLQRISQKPSGGAYPCFVRCNSKGYVLAANYMGGNVGFCLN